MATIISKLKTGFPDDNRLSVVRTLSDTDLMKLLTYVYNTGYGNGHHHTVEGYYTHIYYADIEEYHKDIIEDVLNDR